MSRDIPAKPNVEHLKKQAKELLHDMQEGEPVAMERPRLAEGHNTSLRASTALLVGRS